MFSFSIKKKVLRKSNVKRLDILSKDEGTTKYITLKKDLIKSSYETPLTASDLANDLSQ